jgi:hypothetical protein
MRRKPASVQALTELGRVRLSKSFFMRDMLHCADEPNIRAIRLKRVDRARSLRNQQWLGRIETQPSSSYSGRGHQGSHVAPSDHLIRRQPRHA